MDTKGSDGSRASTAGKADGSWWRWTHGKSGSISSSSSSSPVLAVGGGHAEPASSHVHSLSSSNVHASSSSPVRWLKRSPARGVAREESSSGASAWTASSGSPKFFASFAGSSRGSSVPASRKNRASGSTGRTVAGRKIPTEYAQGEIAWTTGVAAKRKAASRKDRRSGRGSTSGHAVGSRVIGRATRSYLPEFVVDGDAQMASSSVFEFSQDKAGRKPGGSHSTGVSSSSKAFSSTGKTDSAASSPSSSSAASTLSLSSASSMGSSPFAGAGRSDPVVDCARAVLQDCIRQRHMEYNNARKRAIEGWNEFEAKGSGWQHASVTKASDWSMMSSSSSSSSDEELSQLSSLDHSFACDDKYDRDMCESKMSNEEVLRQSMLRGCALSSSPELECFSPLIEEKGLPVEIRYQLPIAMGTANETDKQCTICQIRYGIGDHIVTLPCQHFFHACCVDKWLWNHTSCPLCRTEVSLETEVDAMIGKHKFTECSEVDQDRLRRQLRSTSHGAGFRPVIPADEDLTELETGLTSMSIEGEQESEEGEEYLICPTPQRPRAS